MTSVRIFSKYGHKRPGRHSERGALLVELVIAMVILVVGVLGFLYATQANFNATRDISNRDLVSAAFNNCMETMSQADFATCYAIYNSQTLTPPAVFATDANPYATTAGGLVDASGNPAQVLINFDVNETALPPQYGPIGDLDGDGVLATTDCSLTYQLLPCRMSITFQTAKGVETRTRWVVLGDR